MLLKAMKRAFSKNVLSLSSRNAIDKDSVCRLWDSDEEFKTLNDWWPTVSMEQQAAFVSLRLECKKSLRQAIFLAEGAVSLHAYFSPDDEKKSLEDLGGFFVYCCFVDSLSKGEHLPTVDKVSRLDFLMAGQTFLETYGNAVWGSKIFGIWFMTNNEEQEDARISKS